jgi:hypothetical protein
MRGAENTEVVMLAFSAITEGEKRKGSNNNKCFEKRKTDCLKSAIESLKIILDRIPFQ